MTYDEAMADQLREVATGTAGLSERRMFGGLAFLVHGNMAVAAGEDGLLLRFPPERTAELLAEPHTDEFVMPGRSMKGWLRVEASGLTTYDQVERWAAIGFSYAATLPPK
jgi:TfoX/Sxy family transcriptional regulator of competence genes